MRTMLRVLTLFFLLIAACLLAGVYGILHDQLTYSIAPEYYTRFKFYQFELLDEGTQASSMEHPRFAVSLVGLLATWWLGVPVGIIIGLLSLSANIKAMIGTAFRAFLIALSIAFATGIVGLGVGYLYFSGKSATELSGWFIPDNLMHYRDYIAVGSMHNFSYLGGLLGLVGGVAYIVRKRWIKRGSA